MATTTIPEWLNKEFFIYALTSISDESDCNILTLEIVPALFGENYASEVFKSKIQYTAKGSSDIKHKMFFIKAPVEKGPLVDIVRQEQWAEKELQVYKEYFPLMDRLVGGIDMTPKHFPCKETSTLVLEDLSEEGYIMCDKLKQLDFDHSASVVKTLARFHAASVVVHKHNPTFVETLGVKLFKETASNFVKDKCNYFANIVQSWKGFERFGDICRRYNDGNRFNDILKQVYTRSKTLNVLNHGDVWLNNVMFKYDKTGKIENVKLIDFQIPIYGSIALDLHYFTWTSIQPSVRAQRLPELYDLYLETVNLYFENFGCKERMSQKQFEEEMDSSLVTVYFAFATSHYTILSGKYSNKDIIGEDGKILTTYDDACYRANAEQGLLFLENKGFFT